MICQHQDAREQRVKSILKKQTLMNNSTSQTGHVIYLDQPTQQATTSRWQKMIGFLKWLEKIETLTPQLLLRKRTTEKRE